jgi:membrane protein implicated in regulation of membrane protease activity
VPDQAEVVKIVADCVRYWRETGVPRRAVEEMRIELEQHLNDAVRDGRSPERVVGNDLPAFAESWASEYRKGESSASWVEVTSGRLESERSARRAAFAYTAGGVALVAGVIAGTTLRGGGGQVENEVWRWVWTILAVVAAIAEIFTAGFFLLPIAIGAFGAAILAWFGVNAIAQWFVFFGVSAIAFAYLRRFAQHQDEHQPKVGANRWADARGVVIADILPDTGGGMVRVEGEEWRAASAQHEPIPTGTRIEVVEVRGSKMIVQPAEGTMR